MRTHRNKKPELVAMPNIQLPLYGCRDAHEGYLQACDEVKPTVDCKYNVSNVKPRPSKYSIEQGAIISHSSFNLS